ncbi:hypothetical protein HYPSUDRAFT_83948 [Hypholoma sublateritium FD-334 SS-4]|uniref:Uncharacterized protein n=1 Tax=Hypholoma sublateritium (strain FD-334 SS-4) TaxID=945553 RepID=A0A0D2P7T7_HYPSF|nr:hypothetical protein HYPSUDRAFT_83948 [Hypholoma sublateritium FD-334 SS-4]
MEDSTFHWEEEATLFSELMGDGMHQEEEHRLDDAIESLQAAFVEQGTQSKKQIAEILVGTHKHIRSMINLMDDNVDPYYGNGISLVKKGATGIERTTYAREIEIKEIYDATQRKIEMIFDELKAEYDVRDRLWAKLEASINEIANPLLESVKDTPAQVERTIAKLEKQLEVQSASSKAQNSTNKILQELLKGS